MQLDAARSRVGLPATLIFSAAVLGSAFLLFAVEPMISREVLPRLGGSPSVWNSCVLFFQLVLLAGYAYAHLLVSRLKPRAQAMAHGAVLAASVAFLPVGIGAGGPPPWLTPPLWLLLRLSATVGLPFLALSATAPLLQSWFAQATRGAQRDPYFLYAASNTGSLAALLAYPVLVETTLGLSAQRAAWSAGFLVVALLVVSCGVIGAGRGAPGGAWPEAPAIAHPSTPAPPLKQELRWVFLAFLPSGLMLALTTHIASDVASAPLFWVVPLAIYIATFMVAFGRKAGAVPGWLPHANAVLLLLAGGAMLLGSPNLVFMAGSLIVSLAAFATTAWLFHGDLARQRPPVQYLTRYFLLISAGGALGGVLNGVVAPLVFNGPWEYPILLLVTAMFRPEPAQAASRPGQDRRAPWWRPLLILAMGLILLWSGSSHAPDAIRPVGEALRLAVPGIAALWLLRGGLHLAIGMACLITLPLILKDANTAAMARSFFGTYRVIQERSANLTIMEHGTTLHGMESTLPDEVTTPLAYYFREGPFGRMFAVMDKRMPSGAHVEILGLGAGATACYARPDEHWVFREIDPLVEKFARDTRYFHFLEQCGRSAQVNIGDARITLADSREKADLIVLDVFSSDSVPIHLLTREAMQMYFAHLNPDGVIAFHVSNRYLNLVPVLARLADSLGAPARHLLQLPSIDPKRKLGAEMVMVAPPGGRLDDFAADGWDEPKPGPVLWTDDKSDIYRVIRW